MGRVQLPVAVGVPTVGAALGIAEAGLGVVGAAVGGGAGVGPADGGSVVGAGAVGVCSNPKLNVSVWLQMLFQISRLPCQPAGTLMECFRSCHGKYVNVNVAYNLRPPDHERGNGELWSRAESNLGCRHALVVVLVAPHAGKVLRAGGSTAGSGVLGVEALRPRARATPSPALPCTAVRGQLPVLSNFPRRASTLRDAGKILLQVSCVSIEYLHPVDAILLSAGWPTGNSLSYVRARTSNICIGLLWPIRTRRTVRWASCSRLRGWGQR